MNANHPLFDRTPADHRYHGKLVDLMPQLRREAMRVGMQANSPKDEIERRENDRDFAWVVVPRGAVIGYRIRGDLGMRGELRLARPAANEPAPHPELWDHECATFLKHFGITLLDGFTVSDAAGQWVKQDPHMRDEGKCATRYLELHIGEVRPGMVNCPMCAESRFVTAVDAATRPLGSDCATHGWILQSQPVRQQQAISR